jgi:hypothetical protein
MGILNWYHISVVVSLDCLKLRESAIKSGRHSSDLVSDPLCIQNILPVRSSYCHDPGLLDPDTACWHQHKWRAERGRIPLRIVDVLVAANDIGLFGVIQKHGS